MSDAMERYIASCYPAMTAPDNGQCRLCGAQALRWHTFCQRCYTSAGQQRIGGAMAYYLVGRLR
jgi:glutathione S-transferase